MLLRISETCLQGDGSFTARLSFDHAEEYPVTISSPFDPQEEALLEWYFEDSVKSPFLDHVKRETVAESIRSYGEKLFSQLFSNRDAYARYRLGVQSNLTGITLEIAGTPAFHALHWEALWDPMLPRALSLEIPVVRKTLTPQAMPSLARASATLNVLVLTARPFGRDDVAYRTISRPVLTALSNSSLPVRIDIVRPGTYRALCAQLREGSDGIAVPYHILHLDVHGAVATHGSLVNGLKASSYVFESRYGRGALKAFKGRKAFIFLENDAEPGPDPVEADELAQLLMTHQVPIVILNACQSSKQVGPEDTSLGSRLLLSGVQAVIALTYTVTVTAATLFVSTFYKHLFSGKPLSLAFTHARIELSREKARRVYFDARIDLEDWLLPVLHLHRDPDLSIKQGFPELNRDRLTWESGRFRALPPEFGFLGRDLEILAIERGLISDSNIALLRGMGGAGKTALLQHLAEWWQLTHYVDTVHMFSYDGRAWTKEQIVLKIAEHLLSASDFRIDFLSLGEREQSQFLIERLRSARHLIVLDNLESAHGSSLDSGAILTKSEKVALADFLYRLHGGKSIVLLGSRGSESWLEDHGVRPYTAEVRGLDPESASVLAYRVATKWGARSKTSDARMGELLDALHGYPLAIQVLLRNLVTQSPGEILDGFRSGDASFDSGVQEVKGESILRCIEYSYVRLSESSRDLLLCLAPFSSLFNGEAIRAYVEYLSKEPTLCGLPLNLWSQAIADASDLGLLRADVNTPQIIHLNPALSYFLRSLWQQPTSAGLVPGILRAFDNYYRWACSHLSAELDKSKTRDTLNVVGTIALEYGNILTALRNALSSITSSQPLFSTLYGFLNDRRDHVRGLALATEVANALRTRHEATKSEQDALEYADALSNMGVNLLELHRTDDAERAFIEAATVVDNSSSLAAEERVRLQAVLKHQLGSIAVAKRDWASAHLLCNEALALNTRVNNLSGMAMALNHLGIVAYERGNFSACDDFVRQRLEIRRRQNHSGGIASLSHLAGNAALAQRQFEKARSHYTEALSHSTECRDDFLTAGVHFQLGVVCEQLGDSAAAKQHYEQAMHLNMAVSKEYEQAVCLMHLSSLSERDKEFEQAERYLLRALETFTKLNRVYDRALALHNLGLLYDDCDKSARALECYEEALVLKLDLGDGREIGKTYHQIAMYYEKRREYSRAADYYERALESKLQGGEEYLLGNTYYQLGLLCQRQFKWTDAESHYRAAIDIYDRWNDPVYAADSRTNLGRVLMEIDRFSEAKTELLKAFELYDSLDLFDDGAVPLNVLAELRRRTSDSDIATSLSRILRSPLWMIEDMLDKRDWDFDPLSQEDE